MVKSLDWKKYRRVVFLTGAGISVASGLSTYRGPGGLWTKLDVARIADASNLPDSLPDLWELYKMRRTQALAAEPNAAHRAIADLQRQAGSERIVTLITQNVDGLHQRAGSENVIEMHGSAFRTCCYDPHCVLKPFLDETLYDSIPTCPVCRNWLRPDVVLFSESIPESALIQAVEALLECDLFIAVGTSGVVWPAAQFVQVAAQQGAHTININIESAEDSIYAEEYIGKAEELLPPLLATQ